MRAWLLTVGEPLPTDRAGDRAWRTGLLARQLVDRGHEVVWWSSAFDHFQRRRRDPVDVPIAVDGLTLWQLSGADYRRNISVARMLNHYQVAQRFRALAPTQPRPDVILSSLPTLEMCCAAVDYGRLHEVPVALDVRDLWPEVIADVLPGPLRRVALLAVPWMARQRQHATRGATAILGLTDEFIRWGLDAAGRDASTWDCAFPMGYTANAPSVVDQAKARDFWRARGVAAESDRSVVCFFGTLGWMFDFDTVLAAAAQLAIQDPAIQFVICGTGEKFEALSAKAAALGNVLMPGRVGQAEVWELMRLSIAGLAPYRPLRNFDDNLANKPIEYLSAGLPIIASNVRVLKRLVEREGCGMTYAHGDATSLVNAVSRIHRDPVLRAAQSEQAGRLYRDRFVAEQVYAGMAEHLEQLAATAHVVSE